MKNEKPVHFWLLALTFALVLFQCGKDSDPPDQEPSPKGTKVDTVLYSPGLKGNLLGDSPTRQVLVYLPPGYDEDLSRHYPVIYYLHGYGGFPDDQYQFFLGMDRMIQEKKIKPMIVVFPDSNNRYEGSYYTNSETCGQWEDFIVKDLVKFMDHTYRTIASQSGRGLAGHSMGGFGTFLLVMRNPGIFSAIYATSADPLDFYVLLIEQKEYMVEAMQLDSYADRVSNVMVRVNIACAAAFAPNPNSLPFYGEFPVTESGELVDSTWQKWLLFDPSVMLPVYKDNLKSLRAIHFDCGTSDNIIETNRSFSRALDQHEVEHVFLEYDGDHGNRRSERISDHLLPFFSEVLDHE